MHGHCKHGWSWEVNYTPQALSDETNRLDTDEIVYALEQLVREGKLLGIWDSKIRDYRYWVKDYNTILKLYETKKGNEELST